jgi:hypothetical protein
LNVAVLTRVRGDGRVKSISAIYTKAGMCHQGSATPLPPYEKRAQKDGNAENYAFGDSPVLHVR